jgi:hypothetical protein
MAGGEIQSDGQSLIHENGVLRTIITELLIVNQELRWKLLASGNEPVSTPANLPIP